jgi:CheY-like chemotaxis protein
MFGASPNSTTRNFNKASILVVEDNQDQQALIRYALKQSLAEVTPVFVDSAARALAYLSDCQTRQIRLPRLVLLDLYLPESEQGWHFLREMRAQPHVQSLPVVVLSISRDKEDINKAYQLGANSFISKPIEFRHWATYFDSLRRFWWETATLPPSE